MPDELIEFQYRKMFGLSHQEMLDEPADKFFTNLLIESLLRDKESKEAQWQQRT